MRIVPAIVLVIMVASCGRGPADPRGVAAGETFLSVTATAQAEARPDEARLSLGVQSIGASAADAGRANREKMAAVTGALARLGVAPDDVQTRNVTLQRIDYGPERGRFRADNVVEIRMRAMDRVGEAIALATEAGANLIGGPALTVADPEAATRAAYADAYRAARARAEAYAGAADMAITRVLAIHDGGADGPPRRDEIVMDATIVAPPPPIAMEQAERGVPFSPGVNRGAVRVRVDFALAPN